MSWPKGALVYATPTALRDSAELLGPTVVVERHVQRAVLAGDFHPKKAAGRLGGKPFVVELDSGVRARVVRSRGKVRESPWAWLVLALEAPRTGSLINQEENDGSEDPPSQ